MAPFEEDVAGIGTLAEPVRRELYLYVCAQPGPVGRDEAAAATGIPVHKAKFHLDRLEGEGLLCTEFARLSGKSGPGAGRPSKLYRRADRDIAVSLPQRTYELAGELLAAAIAESARSREPAIEVLYRLASERGQAVGTEVVSVAGSPQSAEEALQLARATLTSAGYEPRSKPQGLELVNCPFHALSRSQTELVCGMNHALITSMARSIAADTLTCTLAPKPGHCCVDISIS